MRRVEPVSRLKSLPFKILAVVIVGLILSVWTLYTPEGVLGKADAIGYAVCHRIDLRSFHLGERQLPVCVRCTGMFLGALLGLGYQSWVAPRCGGFPNRSVLAVMGFLFLAFAVDGTNSYFHLFPGFQGLYTPQHALRLLTGTGMGLTLAIVLYPAFQQTVWADWKPNPSMAGLRSLATLLGLGLALCGLVWLQVPVILYPAALLSAVGVVTLLSMVYTMVAVMIFRTENRSLKLSDLSVPILCGVGLTFLQIGGIDFVRFLFTGTWDGFHFG